MLDRESFGRNARTLFSAGSRAFDRAGQPGDLGRRRRTPYKVAVADLRESISRSPLRLYAVFLVLSALPVGLFSYWIGAQEAVRAVNRQIWLFGLGFVGLGLGGGALTVSLYAKMLKVRNELAMRHGQLGKRVEERTTTLRAEMVERRRATQARRQSEERYNLFFKGIEDYAILMLDTEGRVLSCSPAAERIKGYRACEVIGKHISIFYPPEDRERRKPEQELERAAKEGRCQDEGWRLKRDGSRFWADVVITALRDATGNLRGFAKITRDITERKQVEVALRESEEQYRILFENTPRPMWVYDFETLRFLAVNDAAVQRYGYSRGEFLSMTIKDICIAEDVPALLEDLSKSGNLLRRAGNWRHRTKDGKLLDVDVASQPVLFAGRRAERVLASDLTERKQLEGQLRQSQKMESVGRLAGGIAHDFSNLLTVITGYSQLLLDRAGTGEETKEHLEEIRSAASRAASLTRQLLAFSRRQVLAPQVLELNAVVANVDKLLRRLIGEDIELMMVQGRALGRVKADLGQIEQVIINLALNARDAMPAGGKLTIETANVDLNLGDSDRQVTILPGRYVMLSVSDTGCGMDIETQAHIFEPFFTTKQQGKGTGLGLANVYGVIKQTGGSIRVYSEPGRGSTFKIYLPRVEESDEAIEPAKARITAARGSETILLVEDEQAVRSLVRRILDSRGYTVLEASRGEEALAISDRHEGSLHLIVTDVVMPRISGRELAGRLAAVRPEMKVLFISGYTDDAILHHGVIDPSTAFLQKPFTPDALVHKVREVLDADHGQSRGVRGGDE